MTTILGISAYYHDSAAALICEGKIVAAAQEERFSRKKHDQQFPVHAVHYCLKEAGIRMNKLDNVVFYDKPFIKFERLLETYLAYCPKGFRSFAKAMPIWVKEKLLLKNVLKKELAKSGACSVTDLPPLLFTEHHHSHAASAFYPSPFDRAAVICADGVGEWTTTSVWLGEENRLTAQWKIDFPHSLGLLYSAFTDYLGFRVNSGEYKLMGLAPYGEPKYADLIFNDLLDLKEDGTFRLNMDYFNYPTGLTMTNARFHALFDGPPRKPETAITQREMDIARSIQIVTEEIMLRLARTVQKELRVDYLCLAGGVALNCVANGRILREGSFKDIWVQPASGDAGGALGAAMAIWHEYYNQPRRANGTDAMQGSFLGPKFEDRDILGFLEGIGAEYQRLDDEKLMFKVATLLKDGKVIGWFQGRMEFGPRALGARSIIGDARNPKMQSIMNLKIKHRESFRPFAPAVLAERSSEYFTLDRASPYMTVTAPIRENHRIPLTKEQGNTVGLEMLSIQRSRIPAITNVDYSARVQTVHEDTNPRFHRLIGEFEKQTDCAVLINTSFNVRGEPIVCNPENAFRCFMNTNIDYLVLENFLLDKKTQPAISLDGSWEMKSIYEPLRKKADTA